MKKKLYPKWLIHAFSSATSSSSKDSEADKESVSSWNTHDTTSSSSCSDLQRRRVVRFVVDPPMTIIPNDRTEEEVKVTWISLKETYHNRLKTREMQRRLLQDPEYRAAIEYVKVRLGRHTGSYAIVDLDDDEPNESSIGYETAVITKLTQLDARGLENAGLYASRPTAIHVRSVQEALRKGKPDNYIAELCRQRSGPALAWAQTMGQADAKEVENDILGTRLEF